MKIKTSIIRMIELEIFGKKLAKDPVCGMIVDEKRAINSDIGGRTFYFCSPICQKTFLEPEKELAKMKKRCTLQLQEL